MIALRMGKNKIGHEHYVDAIAEVQAKKKDVSSCAPESPKADMTVLTQLLDCQLLRIILSLARAMDIGMLGPSFTVHRQIMVDSDGLRLVTTFGLGNAKLSDMRVLREAVPHCCGHAQTARLCLPFPLTLVPRCPTRSLYNRFYFS